MGKAGYEGVFEFFVKLFMPIWLPLRAIKIMVKEIREERRRKREEEK